MVQRRVEIFKWSVMTPEIQILPGVKIAEAELSFRFARSGGPGGQNVNKVSTRVELLFDVVNSPSLDEPQKHRVLTALRSRMGADGVLRIVSDESRSQWRNREEAIQKFTDLLRTALAVRKKRIRTKPSASAREERIKKKKAHGGTKKLRGKISPEKL